MDCPICRHSDTVGCHDRVPDLEHGSGLAASFRACRTCGVLFQDPLPGKDALRALYGPDYRAQQRGGIYGFLKLVQARLSARRFQKHIPDSSSRILELGCGAGYLMTALRQAGFADLCGVDWTISDELIRLEPAIAFVAQDITAFEPTDPVDIILVNNVIEHVRDPGALVAHYRKHLCPGGRIILLTPNAESTSHGLFGRSWAGLHSPWHIFVFTARSLSILAADAHFSVQSIASGEDPGGWGISVQNWLRSRKRPGARRAGGSGYGIAAILATFLCFPFALIAKLLGRGSTLMAVIAVDRNPSAE